MNMLVKSKSFSWNTVLLKCQNYIIYQVGSSDMRWYAYFFLRKCSLILNLYFCNFWQVNILSETSKRNFECTANQTSSEFDYKNTVYGYKIKNIKV